MLLLNIVSMKWISLVWWHFRITLQLLLRRKILRSLAEVSDGTWPLRGIKLSFRTLRQTAIPRHLIKLSLRDWRVSTRPRIQINWESRGLLLINHLYVDISSVLRCDWTASDIWKATGWLIGSMRLEDHRLIALSTSSRLNCSHSVRTLTLYEAWRYLTTRTRS